MRAEKTRKEIRFAAECYNINIRECIGELEELERIATEYESNKHYIELGKAVEYAVQNEIRFIRPLQSCEKLIFIDSYDKGKLIKEIIEQGGPFNE